MNYDIQIIATDELNEVDNLANIHPMMSKRSLEKLSKSIEEVGQLEPITLFRGKILDGRNRVKVCKDLGIETMTFIKLPHNASTEDKLMYVKNKENRRHQTPTQLACTAVITWTSMKTKNITQSEFVKQEAISQTNFTNALYVYRHNDNFFKILKNGGKVPIVYKNKQRMTDSLRAIVNFLKQELKTLNDLSERESLEQSSIITDERRKELPIEFVMELIRRSKPNWCSEKEFIDELRKVVEQDEDSIDTIFNPE